MPADVNIEGPIHGGSHGWAFGAAGERLAEGYTEEEYILTGEATKYRHADGTSKTSDGRWVAAPDGTAPFASRFLVRRPTNPADFNGTVVVCWNNVSGGLDMVGPENSQLVEGGFALVGATVQRVGLEGHPWAPQFGLRGWDPERYGRLTIESDDYSRDVFSQIARLVGPDRPRDSIDPLGGLEVEKMLAYGASQSATTLATYINAIQPLDRLFDGFIVDVYFGGAIPLSSELEPTVHFESMEDMAAMLVTMQAGGGSDIILRTDLGVPIMVVNSESEALMYSRGRQPDTDRFRLWEVAGAAHAGGGAGMPPSMARDLGMEGIPLDLGEVGLPSPISMDGVRSAAFNHMQRWLRDGTPAPSQPRIEISGEPPSIQRDDDGNALGGIRLPDMQVPTATNIGCGEDGSMSLSGFSKPFPPEKLRALYPDHAAYVAQVEQAVQSCVDAGVLLPRHADEYVRAAKDAPIP